eukprot:6891371-Prymnesium_polylepis.2
MQEGLLPQPPALTSLLHLTSASHPSDAGGLARLRDERQAPLAPAQHRQVIVGGAAEEANGRNRVGRGAPERLDGQNGWAVVWRCGAGFGCGAGPDWLSPAECNSNWKPIRTNQDQSGS